MIILPSKTIRKNIAEIWPDLQFIVLSDPQWKVPQITDVAKFLINAKTPERQFVPNLFACEEYAVSLLAEVRQHHVQQALVEGWPEKEQRNWPLGIVFGSMFQGQPREHWLNVCVCHEGVYIIEPQTAEYWLATPANDNILFLFM